MDKKYENAILALSEMLLEKASEDRYNKHLIEALRKKIDDLEADKKSET